MSKADDYGVKSICFRAAQELPPAMRLQLLDMAASWQAVADHAERNSKLDFVYETPSASTGQQSMKQQQQIQAGKSDEADT